MWNQGRLYIRVNIDFIKQYDPELLKKYPDYNGLLRVVSTIVLKTKSGWSKPRFAIIDTGAHTSILPLTVWEEADAEVIGEYFVRGLVPKEECILPVKIGWVCAVILDRFGNRTDELRFRAYLAPTDDVPLIIGFKDLMDKCELQFNSKSLSGYIETT